MVNGPENHSTATCSDTCEVQSGGCRGISDSRALPYIFWTAWAIAEGLCLYFEFGRLRQLMASPAGVFGWFTEWNSETTLPLLVLSVLPPLVIFRRQLGFRTAKVTGQLDTPRVFVTARHRACGSLIVCAISLLASLEIGFRPIESQHGGDRVTIAFSELPPVYHDEFSYLLQADTFLAGRLAWPPMSVHPRLFHQVHVLNVPTTASRYFPWTGLWIAPFQKMGHPVRGHWLAGALASVCFYLSLCELLPAFWSLTGGILIAVSPGIAVFSNLLLAHHPALLMLSVFLWAFLRLMHVRKARYAWISAAGLTLAMLGRPMTAAGFALPFGIWLGWQMVCTMSPWRDRAAAGGSVWCGRILLRIVLAFSVCLSLGLMVLAVMNRAITGSWTTSAYQLYTDTWTPRHRYGFDNVVHAELSEAPGSTAVPDSMRRYDHWAENLTPARAQQNVINRVTASLQWTLSMVPLLLYLSVSVGMALFACADIRWKLIWLAVISLHAVHVPYWFDGILHWHYVFETAPLLLMLCSAGACAASRYLTRHIGGRVAAVWVLSLLVAGLLPGWVDADLLWGPSKVSMVVNEQAFSRVRMDQFRWLIQSSAVEQPALVMVDESRSDPQLSYIINPPDLRSGVLVCRLPDRPEVVAELHAAFPDRRLYRFDPETFEIERIE